jgi:hypothetical protein
VREIALFFAHTLTYDVISHLVLDQISYTNIVPNIGISQNQYTIRVYAICMY